MRKQVFRLFASHLTLGVCLHILYHIIYFAMKPSEEKAALCALGRIFGFVPGIALALISHFGSATGVFMAGSRETDEILGPYSRHRGRITGNALSEAWKELETLSSQGISYTGWTESGYPALLKECPDAPVGLYVRSSTPVEELWNNRRSIAIVGTRDISPYGRQWCESIVSSLADTDARPAIVSGLAIGTDICAHRTALEKGLPTIAVMATGIDRIYPFRHTAFAEKLCTAPGCALITDYPPGTPPLAIHFLRRNRIIAGLCESLVLTESKLKGGGMNTARLAFSYDRNVYALPGRVDDMRSQGCNYLIKSKIAEPFISTESFISEHGLGTAGSPGKTAPDEDGIRDRLMETFGGGEGKNNIEIGNMDKNGNEDKSSNEDKTGRTKGIPGWDGIGIMCRILTEIRRERGITIEDLAERTGYGYVTVARYAALLESEGFIECDILRRCTINVKNI